MTTPFYQQLLQQTVTERQQLMSLAVIQQTLEGQVSQARYLGFLEQAYHHVKHTVPLMMACGSRLQAHQHWLQQPLAEYIDEEIGHEQWILNDIKAAGGDSDAVAQGRPHLETEVLVAYAYDSIQRQNPLSFFGMVHVLEGTSIALATRAAGQIKDALGLPANAFSYLLSHGDLDQGHVKFFAELMNRVSSTDDQQAIITAAQRFYPLYGAVLSSVEAL